MTKKTPTNNQTKIQDRKVIKDLEFELTDAELLAKSDRAANASRQVAEVNTEFKSVKDDFTAKLRTLNASVRTDLEAVRTKREVRTVDCIERFDYDNRKVSVIFNKKVMQTREMRGDEFQTFMDLEKARNANAPSKSKKVVGIDSFKEKQTKKNISDDKKLLAEKSHLHSKTIEKDMRNTPSALNA